MTTYLVQCPEGCVVIEAERWYDARDVGQQVLGGDISDIDLDEGELYAPANVEIQWTGRPPNLAMQLRQRLPDGTMGPWVDRRAFVWRDAAAADVPVVPHEVVASQLKERERRRR